MMTSAKHMAWMLDEFEVILASRPGCVWTGKPLGLGGSLGRTSDGIASYWRYRRACGKSGIRTKTRSPASRASGKLRESTRSDDMWRFEAP